ncbi:hypothetical protein FN846DRAFT_914398 [Sphaerosporella brunnea]|uniref:Uncharacterized protein n=1 Tax=Sphaerosporella brunnea TaxID=1250544 RepID=A0A5J5EDU9_9PEZI|nr:hypothetical protein FN846DRAFT_914398 [Sphaerosporella brunnea]
MPSKPIDQGFKFHCLADHGYIYDFHPTSNQAGPVPVPSIPGFTATGEVVYHLLNKLPKCRHWVVLRYRSAQFPEELRIAKSDVKNYEYHSMRTAVVQDQVTGENVGGVSGIDNAPVTMLTTAHKLDDEVIRKPKRPGKKSTNAKNARAAFGEEHEKDMPIPACVDDYNHHMGGVAYYGQAVIDFHKILASSELRTLWEIHCSPERFTI